MENLIKERIMKMREGKQIKKDATTGVIWKIDDLFEIRADMYNYIVSYRGNETYVVDFESAIEDIYQYKKKELLINNKTKDFDGVIKALDELKQWFNKVLKQFK